MPPGRYARRAARGSASCRCRGHSTRRGASMAAQVRFERGRSGAGGAVVTFVVISGAPGSGKSTLAAPLAARLGISLLSFDVIKERLADALGLGDREWRERLGDASDDV